MSKREEVGGNAPAGEAQWGSGARDPTGPYHGRHPRAGGAVRPSATHGACHLFPAKTGALRAPYP